MKSVRNLADPDVLLLAAAVAAVADRADGTGRDRNFRSIPFVRPLPRACGSTDENLMRPAGGGGTSLRYGFVHRRRFHCTAAETFPVPARTVGTVAAAGDDEDDGYAADRTDCCMGWSTVI